MKNLDASKSEKPLLEMLEPQESNLDVGRQEMSVKEQAGLVAGKPAGQKEEASGGGRCQAEAFLRGGHACCEGEGGGSVKIKPSKITDAKRGRWRKGSARVGGIPASFPSRRSTAVSAAHAFARLPGGLRKNRNLRGLGGLEKARPLAGRPPSPWRPGPQAPGAWIPPLSLTFCKPSF